MKNVLGDKITWDNIEYKVVGYTRMTPQEGGQLTLELQPVIDPRRIEFPKGMISPELRRAVVAFIKKSAPLSSRVAEKIEDREIIKFALHNWAALEAEGLKVSFEPEEGKENQ